MVRVPGAPRGFRETRPGEGGAPKILDAPLYAAPPALASVPPATRHVRHLTREKRVAFYRPHATGLTRRARRRGGADGEDHRANRKGRRFPRADVRARRPFCVLCVAGYRRWNRRCDACL